MLRKPHLRIAIAAVCSVLVLASLSTAASADDSSYATPTDSETGQSTSPDAPTVPLEDPDARVLYERAAEMYGTDDRGAIHSILWDVVKGQPHRYAGYAPSGDEDGVKSAVIYVTRGGPGIDPVVEELIRTGEGLGLSISVQEQSESLAALEDLRSRIYSDSKELAAALPPEQKGYFGTGVDASLNQVVVRVSQELDERSLASFTEWMAERYGDAVVVKTMQPIQAAYSRTQDYLRFKGGSRIFLYLNDEQGALYIRCATAFSLTNASNVKYMMTAGHCNDYDGDVGLQVNHGGDNAINYQAGYTNAPTYFGNTMFNRMYPMWAGPTNTPVNLRAFDISLIGHTSNNNAYAGYAFRGGASTQTFTRVSAPRQPCIGCVAYASGPTSGDQAGAFSPSQDELDFCAPYTDNPNGTQTCSLARLESLENDAVCLDGDSGGPVYDVTSSNTFRAMAVIGAYSAPSFNIPAGKNCWVTSVPRALQYWSSTITTS